MLQVGFVKEEVNSKNIPLYFVGFIDGKTILAAITEYTVYEYCTKLDPDSILVSNISDFLSRKLEDGDIYITTKEGILVGQPEKLGIEYDEYDFSDFEDGDVKEDEIFGEIAEYVRVRDSM